MTKASPANHGLDTRNAVDGETRTKRRRRSRARGAGIVRRINTVAGERQRAWRDTDQAERTALLSADLDGLYGDLRDVRKGDPGEPFIRNHPGRTR